MYVSCSQLSSHRWLFIGEFRSTMEEYRVFYEQIRNVKLTFRREKEMQEKILNTLLLHIPFPKLQRVLGFERTEVN